MNKLPKPNISKVHGEALRLSRQCIRRHNLGSLAFLSFVGARAWLGSKTRDYDYRGIYLSPTDKVFQAYFREKNKDIVALEFARFMGNLLSGSWQSLLLLNSPVIYSTKEFVFLKNWINANPCKNFCLESRFSYVPYTRKDYLYTFLELGNITAIFEGKKIISNLLELNNKHLHSPVISALLLEEYKYEQLNGAVDAHSTKYFSSRKVVLSKMVNKLWALYKCSNLPMSHNLKAISQLPVFRKSGLDFWDLYSHILWQPFKNTAQNQS